MHQIKPIVIFSLVAISAAVSSSCATTKGFGQDLQKLGSRVEDRANATGGAEPERQKPAAPVTAPTTPSAY